LRNDLFKAPASATSREAGQVLPRSRAKIDAILPPLEATGVPLGGIGTGSITRASDGRFSRWTIKAGGLASFSMPVNGFLLRVAPDGGTPAVRALQPAPESEEFSAFDFEAEAPEWEGLFPVAWHRHGLLEGIGAECLSFSPVIPGGRAAASLPVALFRWRLTNAGPVEAEVSLAFSFANLNGWFGDTGEGRPRRVAAGCFNRGAEIDGGAAVIFDRRRSRDIPEEGTGEWAIAVGEAPGLTLSRTVCFDGAGCGAAFREGVLASGDAPDLGPGWVSESGFRETPPGHPAGAVAARCRLAPGESREVTFALAWDLPAVRFGQGRRWLRSYTDDWGREGRSGAALAAHALARADDWQRAIAEWHAAVAEELGDLPHRAGEAINQSSFLVDGLTVWTSAEGSPDGREHFGIIECPDYALYNTMDLWIYAAEAVARFFPHLAAGVAEDFARLTLADDRQKRRHRWDGMLFDLNPMGSCPHDLGGPGEDPFVTPNSYTYRDATLWKDLNCDLVLCIWREGQAMGADWRRGLFPAVRAAIGRLRRFDRDGDGLIENDGTPDQTFDNIPMTGPSSYCGGLWIAALLAGARLAGEAGETALARDWAKQAERATAAYRERLFNGRWFRVDTDGPLSEACFIEQLFGPFLARRLGLGEIVPEADAVAALRSIYRLNFLEAGGGEGAVSLAAVPEAALGVLPHQDDTSFQTAEIQPGFNFSLAAQLECWGLVDEAETLRRALHAEMHVKRNLAFQTPAAFDRASPGCRAILNMRPLSVWWMARPPAA